MSGAEGCARDPGLPERIGDYEILSVLGEGGMGTVYLASQTQPVQRKVALKVVKLGLDSESVLARFDQERQALAVMNHEAIAKVFDAGTTEAGQPFFVMEHVEGEPISEFCASRQLSVDDRIELFVRVCEGVQHAHQKGVIHRDLKPSNVLVTDRQGRAVPKIIDFGLARATDRDLDETLLTQQGQLIGTPEYMSPEQARFEPEVVDTRSDIYSLGIMLYELLAGGLPFAADDAQGLGLMETLRRIREVEPQRPSDRASAAGSSFLTRALRGDLDWIVMKAIAKEPERRYATASSLAADLRRYRDDEPVLAGPPSTAYRVKKLLRRHRGQVIAASLVLVALVGGLIAFAIANARARASEALALKNEADAKENERQAKLNAARASASAKIAKQKAETARASLAFLISTFEQSDPEFAQGKEPTIRNYLTRAATKLAALSREPATRCELAETLGHLLTVHGEYAQAKTVLAIALEHRELHATSDPTALARTLHMVANLHNVTGEPELAQKRIVRAIEIHERELGDSPHLAQNLNTLATSQQLLGRLDEAAKTHERVVEIRKRVLPKGHRDIAQSWHNLGIVHYLAERFGDAAECFERSIAIEKAHGTDNHNYATSLHLLAMLYRDQLRFGDAEKVERESLAIREKVLGPDHVHVALSLTVLGELARFAGRFDESRAHHARAVKIAEKRLVAADPDLGWHLRGWYEALLARGEFDEASAVAKRMLTRARELDAVDLRGEAMLMQARVELGRGRAAPARRLFGRVEALARDFAPVPLWSAECELGRAVIALAEGRAEEADRRYSEALELLGRSASAGRLRRGRFSRDYAKALEASGRAARAKAVRAEQDAFFRRARAK